MDFTEVIIQILVQGGAVGIAVALILYHFWKDKLTATTLTAFNTTMAKHLEDVGDVMKENTRAIQQANDAHVQAIEVIKENTRAMVRIEKALGE